MSTYLTLHIAHVYTVFYTIYCTLPMPLSHRSSMYFMYIFSFTPLDVCVLGSCWELLDCLLDITSLLELEAQAFRYTRINICLPCVCDQ